MDRKTIERYGTDILCYRLRTARRKKRMQYEDFDKQLLALDREQRTLWHKSRNLGYEPLIPPVQKGWKRCFVLREDVARGKQAAFFNGMLVMINTWDWSHRRDFLVRRRKKGRKFYVTKPQKLREFDDWEFQRCDFTEHERRYFDRIEYFLKGRIPAVKYVFNEPWRFVLQVHPNVIDKVPVRDAELEARMEYLDKYFERNAFDGRRNKLVYGRDFGRWWINKYKEKYDEHSPLKNRPITRILNELKYDTIHA